MKNKPLRIILDTNLWISFLITKNYSKLDKILFDEKCEIIFSEELLEEFISVIKRPKFRRFFTNEDVDELLETIDDYAEFVVVKSEVDICRDKKDNFLLSLAKDSEADYLITGDNDLLEIKTFVKTEILNFTDFFNLKF